MLVLKRIIQTFFLLLISATFTTSYANCQSGKNSACIEVSVQDPKGEAVPDIVVYLLPLDGQQLNEQSPVITIAQKDKTFSPYISVSQRNQQVDFINQDDITHHIYSVNSGNNFEFKIKKDEFYTLNSFNKSTAISMGCNIHDWMSGHLLIVDTPYFATTNKQGKAKFAVQQLGQYQIVVWHPQLPTKKNQVQQTQLLSNNASYLIQLPKHLLTIPSQQSSDDFDFLSEY